MNGQDETGHDWKGKDATGHKGNGTGGNMKFVDPSSLPHGFLPWSNFSQS